MKLETIIAILRPGSKIQRGSWVDEGMYVVYKGSDDSSEHVFANCVAGQQCRYTPTTDDLAAMDWELMRSTVL